MIEKIVLDYLAEKMEVEAFLEVPKDRDLFLVLEKTGSSEKEKFYRATIAIQSYASTLYSAAQLNEQVKQTMRDIDELDDIIQCKLNSDYNFTDVETKRYRYQAVFDLIHY